MAVAFTETEKIIIKKKLMDSAEECLKKYGVRKTTVDELAKMAGISKGAFYIFFDSKEELFFKVLENFQEYIFNEMLKDLEVNKIQDKQLFANVIFNMFQKVKNSFLISIIRNNELELMYRKLPESILIKHDGFDEILAEGMLEKFNMTGKTDKQLLVATLRAIFMTLLHEKEIGNNFDEAIKILVLGLANYIFGEEEND